MNSSAHIIQSILNSDDFIGKINKLLNSKDRTAFQAFWDFLKEVDGVGLFAHGADTIWKIISSDNNGLQRTLDEMKLIQLIDLILILKFAKKNIPKSSVAINEFLENFNRYKLIKIFTPSENYNLLLITIRQANDIFDDYLKTYNNSIKSFQYVYDLSDLPQSEDSVLRLNIIEEIHTNLKNKYVLNLKAASGYGKSTIAKQYAKEFMCLYDNVYGYSFNYGSSLSISTFLSRALNHFGLDSLIDNLNNYSEKDYFIDDNNQVIYEKNNSNEFVLKNNTKVILKKGNTKAIVAALENKTDILKNLLISVLEKDNNLLILDGLESIQEKDRTIKNDYKVIEEILINFDNYNQQKSRILLTSWYSIKLHNQEYISGESFGCAVENIDVSKLSEQEIEEIFKVNGLDINSNENIIDLLSKNEMLSIPLIVSLVCKQLKKGASHSVIIESLGTDSEETKNIEKYIYLFLKSISISSDLENFMKIVSLSDSSISDKEYAEIIDKLNNNYPKFSQELIQELEANGLAYFDTSDSDKLNVNKGTFDIHPMLKKVYRDKKNIDKKDIYIAYAEVFLEYYNTFVNNKRGDEIDFEKLRYLFDSMYYFALSKKYFKVHEIIYKYVNQNLPIEKGYLINILNILDTIFDDDLLEFYTEEYIEKKYLLSSYKLYRYLLMTLGKPEKALYISISKLNNLENMLSQVDLDSIDKYSFLKDKKYINVNIMKIIEKIDWLIMDLESIKYSGKKEEIDTIKKFYNSYLKDTVEKTDNNIIIFFNLLYERRLFECEYMMKNNNKVNLEEFKELIKYEETLLSFIPRDEESIENTDSEIIKSYAKFPHIIWRDRYIGFILDEFINLILLKKDDMDMILGNLTFLDKILTAWKDIYEQSERYAYLYLSFINLAKVNFCRKIIGNSLSESLLEEIKNNIKNAKDTVFKTGKNDFIIDYYINKIFMYTILNIDKCEEEKKFLFNKLENVDIKFSKYEAQIVSNKINNGIKIAIDNNYPYLKDRLEAIESYRKSQSQSSQ